MTTRTTHTPACLEAARTREIKIAKWVLAHPNYCANCEGAGQFISYYDPSPAGVSLGSGYMTDSDPCPQCTEKGLCPVCLSPGLNDEEEGEPSTCCTFCDYDYLKEGGKPPEWECYCWEEQQSTALYEDYRHMLNEDPSSYAEPVSDADHFALEQEFFGKYYS